MTLKDGMMPKAKRISMNNFSEVKRLLDEMSTVATMTAEEAMYRRLIRMAVIVMCQEAAIRHLEKTGHKMPASYRRVWRP